MNGATLLFKDGIVIGVAHVLDEDPLTARAVIDLNAFGKTTPVWASPTTYLTGIGIEGREDNKEVYECSSTGRCSMTQNTLLLEHAVFVAMPEEYIEHHMELRRQQLELLDYALNNGLEKAGQWLQGELQ